MNRKLQLASIEVPTNNDGVEKVCGEICFFNIGEINHKFVIHTFHGTEKFLTHARSGLRVGSITKIKFTKFKSYRKIKDRHAAQLLITDLIEKVGADNLNQKLNNAPKINLTKNTD